MRDGIVAAGTTGQDGTYPVATTSDWMSNAADATLALPAGSEIVYAELVWGGSYAYGGEDVTASLDTSVSLSVTGNSVAVAPDAATAVTLSSTAIGGDSVRYYFRSANVTAFVAAHGASTYRVGGVPATQADSVTSLNAAGWTLLAVYANDASPDRAISVQVGGAFVDESSTYDYDFAGFCAPDAGTVIARAIAAAIEGDAAQSRGRTRA